MAINSSLAYRYMFLIVLRSTFYTCTCTCVLCGTCTQVYCIPGTCSFLPGVLSLIYFFTQVYIYVHVQIKDTPTPTQNKNHVVTNTTPIWQNHDCPEVHVTIKQKQQKSEHTAHKNTDKNKDERRKGIDATKLLCSNDGTKCLRITQS